MAPHTSGPFLNYNLNRLWNRTRRKPQRPSGDVNNANQTAGESNEKEAAHREIEKSKSRRVAQSESPKRGKTRSRSRSHREASWSGDDQSQSWEDESLIKLGGRTKSWRKGGKYVGKRTKAEPPTSKHAVSAAKKRKKAKEQWEEDLFDVKSVLEEHFVVDPKLRDLLVDSSESIFCQFKSERHPYFHQVADLLGLALKDLHAEAIEKKKEVQWLVENVEQTKEVTLARQDRIETELSEQEAALDRQIAIKDGQKEAVREMGENMDVKNSDHITKRNKVTVLEQAFAIDLKKVNIFKELKTIPSDSEKANKKTFSTISSFFKKMGVEVSLLAAAPDALGHALGNRGPFDQNVIDEISRAVGQYVFTQEEEIGEYRAELAELENLAAAATEAYETANEQLQKTEKEIEVIEDEMERLKGEKKKVGKTLKDFPKICQKNLEDNEEIALIITLFEECYNKFVSLRDRERAPPPMDDAQDEGAGSIEPADAE